MIITFNPQNLSDTGRYFLDCLKRQNIAEYIKTLPGKGISRLNTRTAKILLRSLRPQDYFVTFDVGVSDEIAENDQITGAEKIDLAGLELVKRRLIAVPVNVPMTPELWMAVFSEEYGLSSKDYLINMCRGQQVRYKTRRGEPRLFTAALPEPFKAEKIGTQWLIYV